VRVAVIGCGSAGRRHIANLRALGCEVGEFDLDRPNKVLTWADWDAAVVATPFETHLRYVVSAVAAGTPFYVEKPLGSLDQLPQWRKLTTVVGSSLPVNQVGYQLRFHPSYRAMRQLVPTPLGGSFRCDFDMSTWPGKSYGPPELEASHELDLALDCGLGLEDVVLSRGQYYREWYVYDANASAHVSFSSAAELGDQMYVDAMAHFLECVREGKPTKVPLSDGLRVLEALA
jgi:predicted dehydrogenase